MPHGRHTSVALRDAVLTDENLMGQILSCLGLPSVLALRAASKDLFVTVLCLRPKLYDTLMQNKEKVLAHRQWFEYVRKQLRVWEGVREHCMERYLKESKYDADQDDEHASKLHSLQRKWWREERGWTTERSITDVENGLVRSVIESWKKLGPLGALV
jgi:hypothetical protein